MRKVKFALPQLLDRWARLIQNFIDFWSMALCNIPANFICLGAMVLISCRVLRTHSPADIFVDTIPCAKPPPNQAPVLQIYDGFHFRQSRTASSTDSLIWMAWAHHCRHFVTRHFVTRVQSVSFAWLPRSGIPPIHESVGVNQEIIQCLETHLTRAFLTSGQWHIFGSLCMGRT